MNLSPWSGIPFVRHAVALVGGILIAQYWELPVRLISGLLGFLVLVYTLIRLGTPTPKVSMRSPWLGFLGLSSILLLGYLRWYMCEVRQDPRHITHFTDSIDAYEAVALEDAYEQNARCSVTVSVRKARVGNRWRVVRGKVRISFTESKVPSVRYGDILLVQGSPQPVPSTRNPYAFNQAFFLSLSKIYRQHFVLAGQTIVMVHQPPSSIRACSFRVLRYCKALLTQRIHNAEVRAVVLALTLGQKNTLTPDVSALYVHSGTMHVLAVSGLHVGILCWCLRPLLRLCNIIFKLRWLPPCISLAVLWSYALITGLSPSVLRATTMTTIVLVASLLGNSTNIYNILAVSAFLLLFCNPTILFSVGFQLSYLAVLGIAYLHPRIYKLLTPNYWFFDRIWALTSVSLSAQIATMPLSIYYFRQLPTYFLVANWVVIPAALVILCLGIMVLTTNFWPILSVSSAWLLEQLVSGVNTFLGYIQRLPYSLISPIYIPASVALLLYGLLLLCCIFFHTRKIKYLLYFSIITIFLSLYAVRRCVRCHMQRKLIFYSIHNHQAVAFIHGSRSTLLTDSCFEVNSSKYTYHIRPSQIALGISSSGTYTLEEAVQRQVLPLRYWHGMKIIAWQGRRLIISDEEVSSSLPQLAEKLYVDFLVVEANAVTTLQPLLERFDVGTLVIGASNRKSLAHKLQEEAARYGLCNHHALSQQGGLMVSW